MGFFMLTKRYCILFLSLIFALLLSGCGDEGPEPQQFTAAQIELQKGNALYNQFCADCHGGPLPRERSAKDGRNYNQIQNSLFNVGQMSNIPFLSPEEIEQIELALNPDLL